MLLFFLKLFFLRYYKTMFGMLDYRASKLYWLLFFIPLFVYYIINVIGVPIIVYLVCVYYIEGFIFQSLHQSIL